MALKRRRFNSPQRQARLWGSNFPEPIMDKIKTLAAITIGALVMSVAYAMTVDDRSVDVTVNSDSGRSESRFVDGNRGKFVLTLGDDKVEATWRGDFELDPIETKIDQLGRRLEITHESGGIAKRVLFERSRSDVKQSFFIDDVEQDASPETDAAVADLLIVFLRASGMKADERVTAFLTQGGADAVLEEMTFLESDHALQRYTTALTENAELSGDQIKTLASFLKTMESDHNLRKSLQSIMDSQSIDAGLTAVLIDAAANIEGDHDLRKLVEAFAERSLNDQAMDLALGLYERIEGDHDLRLATEALLENESLDTRAAVRLLLAAAERVEGDHDMRLILTEFAPRYSSTPEMTEAWVVAFAAVQSDHDQRLSIEEVAQVGDHSVAAWQSLIELTLAIEGDHDHRLALEEIADEIGSDPALLAAYRVSAAEISSDRDREQALEAIGDTQED